ncbi:transposase family protein [Streptomyces sp. NPDC048383]|uniref:transposase family protein n=1 Tax=Streptomyces sp. NPDC048383 TaxID=3155386 RepID=UPI003418CF97
MLRREGADSVRKGRRWSLPLEDRVLLVAVYWRTHLTMRQLGPCSGSRSPPPTASSTTSGPCSRSSPARGSPRTPCSSSTAPWYPPATTPSPSNRRTTDTPPTTRWSSTPTPDSS